MLTAIFSAQDCELAFIVYWNKIFMHQLAALTHAVDRASHVIIAEPRHLKTPGSRTALAALKVAVKVAAFPGATPPDCTVAVLVGEVRNVRE